MKQNTNYEKWKALYQNQQFLAFNTEDALLWLKVKAISKKAPMTKFLEKNGIQLESTSIKDQNIELFTKLENNPKASLAMLDEYLRDQNNEWYREKGVDEELLKQDLYKVDTYEWGGDQNNSLDKYLVSHYVKDVSRYDDLKSRQPDIQENAWRYVRTSWYNNWTSYLIESIFKHHHKVISAVGEIKSVDFFLDDTPIDLKVTYFPNQYMSDKLKAKLGGKSELAWLKKKAEAQGLKLGKVDSTTVAMEKLGAAGCEDILVELRGLRKEVIQEAQRDKKALMQWLYEKQGEMRFGAENRLFVILVDSSDMTQSWKMKRAFEQIEPAVKNYLDKFEKTSLSQIDFTFNDKKYSSLADVIFVVK